MSLTTQERSAIRRFLSERFNQSELKQLSFDLGADHELFSCDNKSDFALELYLYCEHRDQVGCLIQQMWRRRPQFSDWFSQLVPRLPSCDDYRQIQIILPDGTLLASEAEFRLLIANFFKIPAEQINILAVATGSNHILMNVPAAAFPLPAKQSISLDNGRIRILSIEEFVMLPAEMQETWRYIAVNHPPQVIDGSLYPTISWQAATVIVHGSEAETAVPTTDTTSDHWLARAANVAKVRAISCDLIVKLAPRESNRLKNVITDFVQAAQQGPISTMQQAQIAFGLGGKTG